jgi:Winged helix DNA-binding domain
MGWRLRRHHLHERAPRPDMLEVAGRICGLHAQLMSSAELTLWARVENFEPKAVQRALWEDRSLVKTWAMRGTLHLLPAADYPLWQVGLSTYRHYLKPAWSRASGLNPDEVDQLVAAVGEVLDGRMLTREELADEVSSVTGSPELARKLGESWGALLKPASFRGRLCYAPSQDQKVRFTRPDQWLAHGGSPASEPADPEGAMRDISRRFLAVNGPATREDFARWWGIAPAPAAKLIQSLDEEVAPVDVEGTRAWMLAELVPEAQEKAPPAPVRLLPAFDQYVIASTRHADHLLPGPFRDRVHRSQGWVSPVVLVDGRMDGVWHHERKGDRLVVEVEPFVDLPPRARRGVEQEAERLAAYVGGGLELAWR